MADRLLSVKEVAERLGLLSLGVGAQVTPLTAGGAPTQSAFRARRQEQQPIYLIAEPGGRPLLEWVRTKSRALS